MSGLKVYLAIVVLTFANGHVEVVNSKIVTNSENVCMANVNRLVTLIRSDPEINATSQGFCAEIENTKGL